MSWNCDVIGYGWSLNWARSPALKFTTKITWIFSLMFISYQNNVLFQKHDIPASAIPCLQYQRAKDSESRADPQTNCTATGRHKPQRQTIESTLGIGTVLLYIFIFNHIYSSTYFRYYHDYTFNGLSSPCELHICGLQILTHWSRIFV